jgi:IS30 family transposase
MTYHQLTQEERYRITALRMCRCSRAEIARQLQRHPSTVGRESRRNATAHDSDYRAEKAHSYATARRRRCRRAARFSATDMARVAKLLRRRFSAEQIAGVWKKTGALRISHETIYRHIRWDRKAGGDLWTYTRIMSKFGRKRYRSHDSRGVLPGKRPIGERPVEVELRKRTGHWEGDTVMGSDMRHCVLTLVERKTGYAIIKKLRARKMEDVTRAATATGSRRSHSTTAPSSTTTLDSNNASHSRSTSPRRTTPGSAAATKTSTDYYVSTCPRAAVCVP